MSRIRRIAEEEYVVLVLLAGFGVVFMLIFPPFLLVTDTWMNLVAGREIWEHGFPSVDELTVYGTGSTWTAQQWLAHLFFYGTNALGGSALLAVATGVIVVGAFALAAAAARSLGAGPRSIWVLLVPVLMAAPWAWTIRSQMLALPLYTGLVWLLAAQARTPTRRIWVAAPLLLTWGQIHGSVVLGALLLMLLGVVELVSSRGRSWRRSVLLLALPPLAALATPYGPEAMARYYYLLLVDPPFAGRVTEWQWADPATNTMFFYLLVGTAIPLVALGARRRRLTAFDLALLGLTLVGAITAIRGIAWFAMACMVFLPVAIGRSLESKSPGEPLRRLNTAIAAACVAVLVTVAAYSLLRDPGWFEEDWPAAPVEAIRGELTPSDRVFADSRHSDWLLWQIPELRGRLAFDVRFELYDASFFDRLQLYGREVGDDWMSLADGYRIVVIDETRRSHTDDFLAEPEARVVYRGDDLTVIARSLEP